MRKILVRATLPLVCLLTMKNMAVAFTGNDSAKIIHVLDGNTNEWKADKFETDKETMVMYAIDHDAQKLYIAMKIPDQRLQVKMMMQGMSMYLDKKGKKREATGIEFPMKRTVSLEGMGGRGGGRTVGGAPDPKTMRENLASTMLLLKLFGFDDREDNMQLISLANSPNIAFNWDDANIMHIEYEVPLNMLGDLAALNGRPLGIGWKIHGMEQSQSPGSNTVVSTSLVGVPAGGGAPLSRAGGGGGVRNSRTAFGPALDMPSTDSRMKDQRFWTRYTVSF